MKIALYVVVKEYRYLRLNGPFQYPLWLDDKHNAEEFTYAKAHQCAESFGGSVRATNER